MQTKLDTKKIITIVAIFLGTGLLLSLIPIIISSFIHTRLQMISAFQKR